MKVLKNIGKKKVGNQFHSLVLVECHCGKVFETLQASVRSGNTKSCGCSRKNANKTHGKSKTDIYKRWIYIKARCENPNNIDFKNYGGRGIKICKEWGSFENFEKWALKNGYSKNLTIERIDVEKGYSPENCEFIKNEDQALNRRNSRIVEIDGEKKCVSEWCRVSKINESAVRMRIYRGMDAKKAILKPFSPKK